MIKEIKTEVLLKGRQNNQCWFSPFIGGVNRNGLSAVIGVMQLVGNDCGPLHYITTTDQGRTWSPPFESQNLSSIRRGTNLYEIVSLYPFYHKASKRTVGIGPTGFVKDASTDIKYNKYKMTHYCYSEKFKRGLGFAVWNEKMQDFGPWSRIDLPDDDFVSLCMFPSQMHECEDGTILCPYYAQPKGCNNNKTEVPFGAIWKVGVLRLKLDKDKVDIVEIGTPIGENRRGGLCEPSIVEYQGQYLMTIRSEYGVPEGKHDGMMYYSISTDGLNWQQPKPWKWNDGEIIETAQTQQHWLKVKDDLYLVYTRKSDLSNGVFRWRAPLWVARVDADSLRLIRESEQVVFPEKGARMGNFSVATINDNEAWVVVGEWLQQIVPTCKEGDPFYFDCIVEGNSSSFNRMQFIGDLLLARILFV